MKSVLLIIFILSAQISVAQHLTFSDLLTLHESNIEKSDLLLTNRGFIFSESINQDDKTVSTGWLFKRSGNLKSSNEYFYKDCKGSKCDRVQYFISDANCFNSLKENAKKNGAKYMFTDSDAKVGQIGRAHV